MKQNWHALTQVRMPSNSTSVNSTPQSCPASRSSVHRNAPDSSPMPSGTKTSSSATSSDASQRQSMMSRRACPFTRSTLMPGSSPASQAGLPSSTDLIQAASAWGLVEA